MDSTHMYDTHIAHVWHTRCRTLLHIWYMCVFNSFMPHVYGTSWYILVHPGTSLVHPGTSWYIPGTSPNPGTCRNCHLTFWAGTSWYILVHPGTSWYILVHPWYILVHPGTSLVFFYRCCPSVVYRCCP